MVVEQGDGAARCPTLATRTVMTTLDDRVRLAGEVITFAEEIFP
jgi:hypothetical protein